MHPSLPLRSVKELIALLISGQVQAGGTPKQFGDHLRREIGKWSKIIRTLGLRPESGA